MTAPITKAPEARPFRHVTIDWTVDPLDPQPDLTEMALNLAVRSIETPRGPVTNIVGRAQAQALYLFLADAAKKLHGITKGRTAFGIDTGGGKSTAIAAFIATQWVAGHLRGRSLAVACNHIAALCTMRDKLTEYGMSLDLIGLSHADESGSHYAPNTLDELKDRPVLLATHARARAGEKAAAIFTQYREANRDLVLWDEGLIGSKGLTFGWSSLDEAVGFLAYKRLPALAKTTSFLADAKAAVDTEVAKQSEGAAPSGLRLIDDEGWNEVSDELACFSLHGLGELGTKAVKLARRFVEMAEYEVTPTKLQDGQVIIGIRLEVPPWIESMCILDASVSIRILETMDNSIEVAKLPEGIKTYEALRMNVGRFGSGREKTAEDLSPRKRSPSFNAAMLKQAILQAQAEGTAVLCVTFKDDDEVRYRQRLAKLVGPIIGAKLKDGRPLVNWTTWGNHDSLNDYAHCGHVVLCGVLHLPNDVIAAQMAAQAGKLTLAPQDAKVREVRYSEVAHAIYQAASRGRCRVLNDGKAGAMTLWLALYYEGADAFLQSVLPGATWDRDYWPAGLPTKADQKAQAGKKATASKAVQAGADLIATYLRAAPKVPVSSKVVRAATGLEPDMFKRAAKVAAEALVFEWTAEGRSWLPA